MPIHQIEDPVTIRSLLEVEAWLASVDPRRLHSLQKTSSHLCSALEAAEGGKHEMGSLSIPLRLPASLHTKDRIAFVGLGWPNMSSRFSVVTPEKERLFLKELLQELNLELALLLDSTPSTDRLRSIGGRSSLSGAVAMPAGWRRPSGPPTLRWWTFRLADGS